LAGSAEEDQFLRNDLKDLRSFMLKRVFFFIDKKVKKEKKINHPGRGMDFVKIRYSIAPATPPSKGGETFSNPCIPNSTLRLTAMPPAPSVSFPLRMLR